MKYLASALVFVSISSVCYAQTSQSQITSGIDAMSNAQDQNQAQAEAVQQAQEQARAQAAAQEQAQEAAAERRQAAANAAAQAEAEADKNRNQDFQDQERKLLIESQEIQLQKEQTDANRENDIITNSLKQQAAHTDETQSQADANRVLAQGQATAEVDRAEGAQSLMTDVGKAEVKKSGGFLGSGIGGN